MHERGVRAGVVVILWSLLVGLGSAQEQSGRRLGLPTGEEAPVTAQLIAEHTSLPPGGTTRIGVLFTLEEGWHIYAQEPGDAGLPTSIEWQVPEGVTVGSLHWPPHLEFLDPGNIRTFGYKDSVILWSPLSVSTETSHPLSLGAEVLWLACKEICIQGSASLTLDLPVRAEPPEPSPHAGAFPN